MSVRIVRLGTARSPGEGLRIGTVRRPPRGVPKAEFARQNWYDVWYPLLAPTDATLKLGQEADTDAKWATFMRKYRAEMSAPAASRSLDLLAALSRHADFRWVLLRKRGALPPLRAAQPARSTGREDRLTKVRRCAPGATPVISCGASC
jgi:uncharacterized protein YeaO (DUF488 family)